jgi:copper chaperone NosL
MKFHRILMIVGALLLLALFVWPMWRITLEAPQYPDSIGMYIYIDRLEGVQENDIKNINIMNHYVGMKEIPESIPEFAFFPKVVWTMAILGVLAGIIGRRKLYLAWFVLMCVLGSIGLYDFYLWEYDYGHNLKENAAIKFTDEKGNPMAYQPPLIGSKTILNFKAISTPQVGAYLMFAGMAMSVLAFYKSKNEAS